MNKNRILLRDRYFESAIMICIANIDGKDCFILEKRAKNIRQAGEISFPGGKKDKKDKNFRESFEIVTARAVARLNVLVELCLPLVKKGGYFLSLKAQKAEEETDEAITAIKLLGGKLEQDIEFDVEGEERHILEIRKAKETPNKYPRKAGTPNKKPLL